MESGWETPLLIHAVLAGADEAGLLRDWRPEAWLADAGLAREAAGVELDRVRDEWIARDEAGWLASHRFYPGVIERLRGLARGPVRVCVLTTKEGRFARTLLARQGVPLDPAQVYGKEAQRPKRAILAELAAGGGATRVWFVEDRLKTLEDVQRDPALDAVGLFLAAWGYNTAGDREATRRDDRIVLLSLAQFAEDFPAWLARRPFH